KEFGSSSNNVFLNVDKGFPTKCTCGSDVTIYTSQSNDNPGRLYFRCSVSRKPGHLFKWVEDVMYEEVMDLKQNRRESEVEVNELMGEILNVKEEVQQCKSELRNIKIKNMVVLVLCLCVLAIVIIYHIMFQKVDRNTLVFGKK
ncbi:unnamed protein product, partial [Thlaspi arvense]